MATTNWSDFEKAVRLLAKYLPAPEKHSRKPILSHDLRVGVYLYENDYSPEIVLAGILHDALEWSKITKKMLKKEFGDEVLKLVQACTKDDSIKNSDDKIDELIKRCAASGQDALIIKAADILDSFKWYSSQNNQADLKYCVKNIEAIFKYKPKKFKDKIFDELKILAR
jgi:(p)ppGpp synthase/HD superfamily hydrolase